MVKTDGARSEFGPRVCLNPCCDLVWTRSRRGCAPTRRSIVKSLRRQRPRKPPRPRLPKRLLGRQCLKPISGTTGRPRRHGVAMMSATGASLPSAPPCALRRPRARHAAGWRRACLLLWMASLQGCHRPEVPQYLGFDRRPVALWLVRVAPHRRCPLCLFVRPPPPPPSLRAAPCRAQCTRARRHRRGCSCQRCSWVPHPSSHCHCCQWRRWHWPRVAAAPCTIGSSDRRRRRRARCDISRQWCARAWRQSQRRSGHCGGGRRRRRGQRRRRPR